MKHVYTILKIVLILLVYSKLVKDFIKSLKCKDYSWTKMQIFKLIVCTLVVILCNLFPVELFDN